MDQKLFHKYLFQKVLLALSFYQIIHAVTTCGLGTYFDELKGDCEQCFQGCSNCNGYQQKDCLDCLPNYYKIQLQNQFLCLACPIGQYFYQNQCLNCKNDCDVCLSLNKCLVCKIGYLMSTTYEICSTTSCAYGYFRNPLNNLCQQCPQANYFLECGVTKQTTNGVVTGFTLFPIKCFDTFQINTNLNTCGCLSGVYLENGVCVPCKDANCQICSQSGCTYCKIGYFNQQGKCVVSCSPSYYYSQSSNNYHFSCSPFVAHKIVQINGQNVTNYWKGYDPNFGVFDDICQPFLFKLFNYPTNSYQCVSVCPIGYTLNLIRLACVQNNCSNDITLSINGNCFFRTCPEYQFFQAFQSFSQYSTCIPININQCLYQQDESNTQCFTCQPTYFTSSCVQNCASQIFYVNNNSCIKCDMTTPTCSQNNFIYTYNVNGVDYYAYICPTGYYLPDNSSQCTLCSDPAMVSCDLLSIPRYICDIGEDNTNPTCPAINLSTMVNFSFDKFGNIVSGNNCKQQNPTTKLCIICNSQYNYNFNGVCSQQFVRPTQYFMYKNVTENQYRVVASCNSNQYIQKIQISSYNMKICKDFATCLSITEATINGQQQQICSLCPPNFYNINGNCVESCPTYTFQNALTKNCETPISNCDTYSSQSTPSCTYCQYGYLLYLTSPSNQCIPFNSCNNGYTYVYNLCVACDLNCNKCLSNKKCIEPSTGFYLYNDSPVSPCPPATYLSGFKCLDCAQYCLSCTDSSTCLQQLPASMLYLVNTQVYVYFNPICQLNQYFDANLQQCVNCDQHCAQCYQISTKCLLCTDSNKSLYQDTCVDKCPKGYYTSLQTTTNYTRNVCLKCDSTCSDCNKTTCTECASLNMYQNPTNTFTCLKTNDPCCTQVDFNTGTCQQCQSSCFLDNMSSICYQNIPQCTQYLSSDKTKCNQCSSGYYLTSQFHCCGVQNCKICNSNNLQQCNTCDDTYKIDSNYLCQFDCLVQYCQTCQPGIQNKCQNCISQYKTDVNFQCIFDCQVQNCQTCQSGNGTKCQNCISNYLLDANNQCVFDCKVSNCEKCVSGEQNKCQKCNSQYKVDSKFNCVIDCQVVNCSNCISNNQMQCDQCDYQYKLDSQNQCVFDCLVQNCQQCVIGSQNECSQCISQYKLDAKQKCILDCQVQNCEKCVDGNQNQCQKCNQQYKFDSNNVCVFDCQVSNCQKCVNGIQNQCQICNSQYKTDQNGLCIFDCQVQNCQSCVNGNQQQCQNCISQYKLDSNLQCIFDCKVQNCQTCVDGIQNQCKICQQEYILDLQGLCIFDCKVSNCQECILNNQNACQTCLSQYKLDQDNNCVFDCQVSNCQKCVQGNQVQCQTCIYQYKLDSNYKCIQDCQVSNCQICVQNNMKQCSVCNQNYSLDSNFNCQLYCKVPNCDQCQLQDPQQCLKCSQQYQKDVNNQCVFDCQVLNCQNCVVGKSFQCEACKKNYKLDSSFNCLKENQIFKDESQKLLTNIISIILGVLTYSLLFFLPFWMFISVFDLLQTINLLVFANASYPLPLYIFLKIFDFSNFQFLPTIPSQTANVPNTFQREKVHSNIFINMIQPSIIWFIALFFYFLSYLHKIVNLKRKNIINKTITLYNKSFFFMTFIGLVYLTYYKYSISFQLQIYDSNMDTLFQVPCIILSGILIATQIILVFYGFQTNKLNKSNSILQKIEQRFQEFSTLQFIQKYHFINGIILFRKTMLVYVLIFLSETKVKQIIFIQLLYSIETLFILLTKPFPDGSFNKIQILSRFCLLTGSVCINWIIYDDLVDQFSENVRISLSIIAIIFFSIIYLSIMIFSLKIIKLNLYRNLMKRQNKTFFNKVSKII